MRESENPFAYLLYNSTSFEVLAKDLIGWYFQYQVAIWTALILLTPIFATFFLPLLMLGQVYLSAFYLKAVRYYYKISGYTFTPKRWEEARSILAYLWDLHGSFWYGYEIEGLDRIPTEGPALIVFYHGAVPVDYFYLLAKTIIYKKRLISTVGDRILFSIPGFGVLIDCFQLFPGTVETCADVLKKGNLLAISPGGGREALFGDEMYPVMWGTRKGFAKVAIEAKVPIIPVFTENIREAFFTLRFGKKWLRAFYERTRFCLIPVFGGFPIKLKTFVGQPIEYESELTPDEMAAKVADRMREMIKNHQQLPGSVTRSIGQRILHFLKVKTS